MFANYFLVGYFVVGVVLGMPSSSPPTQKSLGGVESSTVPILRPPPSTSDFDEDDDAVIIDADDTSPPLDLTPSTFNSSSDCFLPPGEKGPCKAIIESWTYNPASSSCISFSWSGCGGNFNRFSELAYCNTHCTNVLLNNTATKQGPAKCPKFEGCGPLKCGISLDPGTGCQKCDCNLGTNEPKIILGSVSGNPEDPNQQAHIVSGNTKSKLEEKKGTGEGKPEVVCHLPETRGNCRAMMTRWRYNPELKECVQFHYGGCSTESFPNNFNSAEKCSEFCKGQ